MSNKILITGSNSGIGSYLANILSQNNEVIGVGRGENNIERINYIKGDLNEIKTLEIINKSKDHFDYIIINAGVGYFDKFENTGIEKHRETIETNLLSPILLLQLLIQEKKIKKGIIFMGSIASKKSMQNGASYAASKFGLRGFAMQLKNELKGIKVHIINPSIVEKKNVISSEVERSVEELNNEKGIIKSMGKKHIPPSWLDGQCSEITLKNNFEHFGNHKKTTLDDILGIVNNIINGDECRFEIDL